MTNKKYLYITLLSLLGMSIEGVAQQTARSAPRLVVSITIDQLRSDYLDAFAPLYTNYGFRQLMAEGLVYANASFPFIPVDRASAVAAIVTGTTPYYNGIVGCRWLNRETLRPVWCVDDTRYSGLITSETASPELLATSTLGDELAMASQGKALVFAIAPFRDAAVLSAGHAANGALWIDDISGNWCSSTYYFKTLPPWVTTYNGRFAPSLKIGGVTWEPFNEIVGSYSYFMQGSQQQKPFKHKFNGDQRFRQFKASGMVNAEVTDMARRCIESTGLGYDAVTDLLSLTYYAGTYDQLSVTDCQMELQDTYVRLDYELGRLIAFVEQRLGRDNVLFVITSTGYSNSDSESPDTYRIPTGTFYMNRMANLLNMYYGAIWGQGKYVDGVFRNQVFLNHQLLETRKISISEATSRAQEFVALMSGVRNVYTSLQLLTNQNEQIQRICNGFNPEHCGDLVLEVAPGWRVLNEDTQEYEFSRASFTPFPIIVYGANTPAERITTPVTTDRIAPSIARSIRIRAPNACASEPLF